MNALLLLLLFWAPSGFAQDPCNPPATGLEDLATVFSMIYEETDHVAADPGGFCPDDLAQPLDMGELDARAAGLDAGDRQAAAELLRDTVATADPSHVQALANAAALLDALLGAAIDKGDDFEEILNALIAMAADVQDPLLHRQIALNLWRRGVDDDRVLALLEAYLPTAPDYDHIFAGGKTELSAMLHTGDDGFEHSDFQEVFERAGAEVTELDNGDLQVVYKVKPDDPLLPEITWNLTVRDSGWPPKDVLSDFDNDEIDVSMFGDHSQLGTSIDRALSRTDPNAQSTDFYWMDACKSKVFASRLSQAFPKAHFVYTKQSEYFHDMPISLQRGLVALSNHYDYEEMRRYVASGSAYQGRNYLFPDDEGKLAFQDQDGDGLADSEDRIYDAGPEKDGGLEKDGGPEKDGEHASRAVHIANTYMGYSPAFGRSTEDDYRPDGIFDGPEGGPYTRIEERKDAYGQKKYFVQVSDETLTMDQSQRTASIAAEIAAHHGVQERWSEAKQEAGSFLLGAAVYDVWRGSGWSDYNEQYLSDVSISQYKLGEHLDDHDFVTSSKLREFQQYLQDERGED